MNLKLALFTTALVGAVALPQVALADDDLYMAISKYLINWQSYRFEAHESRSQGAAVQAPRFTGRNAKGVYQMEKSGRWSYTVTMSDDYQYPLAGEVTPPFSGDFVQLPPTTADGGSYQNSWQKQPGSDAWKQVTTTTLAMELWEDYLFHATTLGSGTLKDVKPKGTFKTFGAEANKDKPAIFYQIDNSEVKDYHFGFWIDADTKDLMQISVSRMAYGENREMTIAFWDVNKAGDPVIAAPAGI